LPTGIVQPAPNLFEPSALDEREREQWLRQTRRSIDFAAQVRAGVLVCHLGSVKFFWLNPARRLRAFGERNPKAIIPSDPAYQALLKKSVRKLRKRKEAYWEQTKRSVQEAVDYAKDKGVKLGFENRERFEELPLDEDYPEFLASFASDAAVGYWHDTGHADIKESAGLFDHRAQLEKMRARLIGFHLHDVDSDGRDHQPVGAGKIDFKMVSEFWRPEHKLVLELSPRVSVAGVQSSRERLEELASTLA
jgi:sugar phosphate isomerase/epimerase